MSYCHDRIWIIGASAGIGAALAAELAGRGASLILSARDAGALDAVAAGLGAAEVLPLDISDPAAVHAAVASLSASAHPPNRIIVMAAVYQPMRIEDLDAAALRQMLDVNLYGVMLLSQAVLPMLRAVQGQLVLCGSVAAYVGLPGGQPYSASKAALRNFAESLRAEMEDQVDIRLLSPGFVRTRMTELNDFDMPMRMEPEAAAHAIGDALLRPGFEAHFPRPFTLGMKLLAMLPYRLQFWVTSRINRRD